jgi:hypothetical protein
MLSQGSFVPIFLESRPGPGTAWYPAEFLRSSVWWMYFLGGSAPPLCKEVHEEGRVHMKVLCSAAALLAILVAGCGGTSVPGNPLGTSGESTPAPPQPSAEPPREPPPEQPRPPDAPRVQPPDPKPPGALGSPIDYDSTQTGPGDRLATDVQRGVEQELDQKAREVGCPQRRCGITVVIKGSKSACAKSITPSLQVRRGGTVSISTGPCPDTGEPPPPEEDPPNTGN